MKDQFANLAYKYLQISNYKLDRKTLELQLLTHPEYPSLKSVSDTFDYFGIENLVARVPKEAIKELPRLFMAIIEEKSIIKTVIVEQKKDRLLFIDEALKKRYISYKQFKDIWSGTIIAIEENKKKTNSIDSGILKVGLILCAITGIGCFTISTSPSFLQYSLLSLIGLGISYFIIEESFGISNTSVNKICETVSRKGGCNTVINDKSFRLFKIVSLSDASIIYFSSIVLSLSLIGYHPSFSFILSICSLPVILYSIYYQGIILKQWCALCLGISAVLVAQMILFVFNLSKFTLDFNYSLRFFFILLIIGILWNKVKNMLISKSKLELTEAEFFKFKRNKYLFENLLTKNQLDNNNIIPLENKLIFGSENPKLTITAVTNPLCGFCVEAFKTYYKLLEQYDDIQLQLIFSLWTNDIENPGVRITASVLDFYTNHNKEKALKALKDWYDNRNFEDWIVVYPLLKDGNSQLSKIINSHRIWLDKNQISYTPATFINDFYYPSAYNIDDLNLFIDDMLIELNESVLETT